MIAARGTELKAVAGAALPQIDATGKVARTHANGSFFYGPVNELDVTANQFSAGPSLAYDLDVFGGIRRSIEAQQAQTEAVRALVIDTYETLVDQIVINAFDYAATCAQIDVTRSLVADLRAQYEFDAAPRTSGQGSAVRYARGADPVREHGGDTAGLRAAA